MKNFSTLSELIGFQAFNFSNPRALNFKENSQLKSFSNRVFLEKTFHFACALKELGLEKNQTIANISYQNPIWLIVDFGSILAGAATVPIFANISTQNLFFEISDSNSNYVFTDNLKIFDLLKKEKPQLKIITYGFKREGAVEFEDFILLGKKAAEEKKYDFDSLVKINQEDDLATIIYTSGSTGKPKGVELTHKNLVSQIKATAEFFPLKKEEIILSFLPLAHVFERMVMMFYISQGVEIHFTDDIKNLGNLLKETRPNLMTTVPRMLEKIFLKIKDGVDQASFLRKILGRAALKKALESELLNKKTLIDKIFDRLIYKKFRDALGGNIRMIICGGAPLSKDLQHFYKNIGVNLFCGYGLSETSPVISANCPKAYKIDSVGKLYPQVEARIADDGELLVRGANIMRGYHNDPVKTSQTIENGWLKTGDLAQIDEEGFVKIVGRKKEIFKTANGKYVCPVLIEQ